MPTQRTLILSFAALVAAACASTPKPVATSTETVPEPAAERAEAAPAPAVGSCTSDAECASGEACTNGTCEPAPSCALLRVAFAFDSAQLDDDATGKLRENAQCLSQRGATALVIEGHADERGTTEYNVALGAKRADAVKRYLAALGVKARLETISFGEEIPAAQGEGESVWAQNRRAELRLPGEARSDGSLVPASR